LIRPWRVGPTPHRRRHFGRSSIQNLPGCFWMLRGTPTAVQVTAILFLGGATLVTCCFKSALSSSPRLSSGEFTETDREEIVAIVAADPACGAIMPGTGGFRQVRVGSSGMGKRGGRRAISIRRNDASPPFSSLFTQRTKNKFDQKGTQRASKTHR